MRKPSLLPLVAMILICSCSGKNPEMKNSYNIIPAPAELIMLKGAFTVDDKTAIVVSPLTGETALAARFLADMLSKSTMVTLPVSESPKAGNNSIFNDY